MDIQVILYEQLFYTILFKIIKILYIFFVRGVNCELNTKNYETIFLEIFNPLVVREGDNIS